jgi:ABC-type transporter Mla MlaB component
MLRIETRAETPDTVTYALAGQITREHLDDLRELLAAAGAAGRRVTLDLSGVVLVDREAVGFLAQGPGAAVELLHCPAYVLSWLRCECAGGEKARKPS